MWDKTHVIYVIQPYCFPFLLLVLSIIPKRESVIPIPPFSTWVHGSDILRMEIMTCTSFSPNGVEATGSCSGPTDRQVSFICPVPGTEKRPQVTKKCFTDANHSSKQMGKLNLKRNLNSSPLLDIQLKWYLGFRKVTWTDGQQLLHL